MEEEEGELKKKRGERRREAVHTRVNNSARVDRELPHGWLRESARYNETGG